MLLPGCPCCGCPVPDLSVYDYIEAGSARIIAQSFVTPLAGMTLRSVSIVNNGPLEMITGTVGGGYDNAPIVTVWSSSLQYPSGSTTAQYELPNAQLATLTPPTSFGGSWVYTHAGLSLSGGTRYYIAMRGNGTWGRYQIYASASACGGPIAAYGRRVGVGIGVFVTVWFSVTGTAIDGCSSCNQFPHLMTLG